MRERACQRRSRSRPPALPVAALVFAIVSPPLAAQTFDRFFTTASERLMLDQARKDFSEPAPAAPAAAAAIADDTPRGPVVPQITISGVVIRARGQDTSWINGSGIRPDEITAEGIRVQPRGGDIAHVQIVLPESSAPISLRPGQRIDLATGAVLEAYQRDAPGGGRSVFDELGETRSVTAPDAEGGSEGLPESSGPNGG